MKKMKKCLCIPKFNDNGYSLYCDCKIPNTKFSFSTGPVAGPYIEDLKGAIELITEMVEKLPETENGCNKGADWMSKKEIILYSLNSILNKIEVKENR